MDQKSFDDYYASQTEEFKQVARGLSVASSLFKWITKIHPEMIPEFVDWLSDEMILEKPRSKTELINKLNGLIKIMIENQKNNN